MGVTGPNPAQLVHCCRIYGKSLTSICLLLHTLLGHYSNNSSPNVWTSLTSHHIYVLVWKSWWKVTIRESSFPVMKRPASLPGRCFSWKWIQLSVANFCWHDFIDKLTFSLMIFSLDLTNSNFNLACVLARIWHSSASDPFEKQCYEKLKFSKKPCNWNIKALKQCGSMSINDCVHNVQQIKKQILKLHCSGNEQIYHFVFCHISD